MKRYYWIAALVLILGAGSWSCEKEHTPYAGNELSTERDGDFSLEHLVNGLWAVQEFNDNGTDKTRDFNGYLFRFNRGGELRADSDFDAAAGLWMHAANDNPLSFIIEFNEDRRFAVLNREWHITMLNESAFSLEYVGDPINQTSDIRDMKILRFKNTVPPEGE